MAHHALHYVILQGAAAASSQQGKVGRVDKLDLCRKAGWLKHISTNSLPTNLQGGLYVRMSVSLCVLCVLCALFLFVCVGVCWCVLCMYVCVVCVCVCV